MTRVSVLLAAAAGCVSLATSGMAAAQDDPHAAGDTSRAAASVQDIPVGAESRAPVSEAPGCPTRPAPPHRRAARPGQCFARAYTSPTYERYSERVLISPARRERNLVAAVYDWGERQVLVAPARVERHVIAAVYREVTETQVVTAASTRVERIDPVYDTVSERVMVHPAHSEWRRTLVGPDGLAPEGSRLEATGELVCLVEIPAEYSTVQRRVIREPGRTIETPVPPVIRTVTRQVLDRPEQVVETQIPAVTRTERYQRLVVPAHYVVTDIPARYEIRIRQRQTSPGRPAWRRSACDPVPPKGERG